MIYKIVDFMTPIAYFILSLLPIRHQLNPLNRSSAMFFHTDHHVSPVAISKTPERFCRCFSVKD